jgi:hypothetical protein
MYAIHVENLLHAETTSTSMSLYTPVSSTYAICVGRPTHERISSVRTLKNTKARPTGRTHPDAITSNDLEKGRAVENRRTVVKYVKNPSCRKLT